MMTIQNPTHSLQELSADSALQMLIAAKEQAEALGVAVCISVVGSQGIPLARLRMNGAPLHSIDYAEDKAYTAVSFKCPTHEWDQRLSAHPGVQQALAGHPRMLMLGGGLPVTLNPHADNTAQIVGAVGVSGASVDQDIQCAEAAISVWSQQLAE